MSTVRLRVAVAGLPAASVATAVTVSRPWPAVATEVLQAPPPSTVTAAPFTVSVEPISAVPETVTPPAASAALIRSSPPSIVLITTAGAVVSMVTWNAAEAAPWLPAASLALAVSAWAPSSSTEVVIENTPPVATPVPSTVVPSVS